MLRDAIFLLARRRLLARGNTKPSTGKKVPVDENEDEPQSKPSTGKKVEAVDSEED